MKTEKQLAVKKLLLSKRTISNLDTKRSTPVEQYFTDVYAGCLTTGGPICTRVCNTYAGCTTDGNPVTLTCVTYGGC